MLLIQGKFLSFVYSCSPCGFWYRDYLGQIWTDSLVFDEKALKYTLEIVGEVRFVLIVP